MTINIIKEKLTQLKALDTDYQIFGASKHQYQLNPRLDLQDITDFESKFHCQLPIEYKLFLTEIGNGGAGPSYGVFPLGSMDDCFDLAPWTDDFVKPHLAFKFTDAFNDDSMLNQGEPKQSDFASEEEFYKAHDKWVDDYYFDLQDEYWEKHALDGAIPICHHGCCHRSWLVVAEGDEYGHIWEDLSPDFDGVAPATLPNKKRITFFDWYLNWLDESLQILVS